MVLNNFYFALGGVAALVLYGLCGWKKEWASSPAVLIKSLWHQFYPAFFGGLCPFLSCPYLLCHAGRQERRQQRILEGAFPAGDRIGQDSIPSLRNGTYSGSGDRDRDKSVLPEKPGEIYGSVTYRSAAVSGF